MIQLYRAGNNAFKLDSCNPLALRIVTKAQLERKAMVEDSVAITLVAVSTVEFDYRDYIIVDGRPYFLNLLPKAVKSDKRKFTYELKFEGGMYELGRVVYTMTDLHGWDYIGTLYDYCNLVVNEMNRHSLVIKDSDNRVLRYSGRRIGGLYYWYNVNTSDTMGYFTTRLIPLVGDDVMPGEWSTGYEGYPRVTQVGGAWTLDFELDNGKPVETDEKMLTYDNHTCLAVMHDLVSQWQDWEFAVDVRTSDICNLDLTVNTQVGGKIVVRRRRSVTSDTAQGIYLNGCTVHLNMAFGKKGGISKLTREYPDESNLPSRIYFYGGMQNLPLNYRNTRLCLTSRSKEQSYIDTGFTDNASCEAVKIFDEIYPANKPFRLYQDGSMHYNDNSKFIITMPMQYFFNIFTRWKDPNEATQSQYGSYAEWRKTYGTGNANTDLDRYLLYYYQGDLQQEQPGFPKSCYLTTDSVTITFQTGDLAGHSFKIVDFDWFSEDLEYEITLACEGNESMFPNEPIQYFPNGDVMCKAGDKFIIEGILMPAAYVYGDFGNGELAAETMLDNAAREYIDALAAKIKVGVEISQDYITAHSSVFRLYDRININDGDLLSDGSNLYFRVERVLYDLLKGSYKVEIDDGKGKSAWSLMAQYMKKIADIK